MFHITNRYFSSTFIDVESLTHYHSLSLSLECTSSSLSRVIFSWLYLIRSFWRKEERSKTNFLHFIFPVFSLFFKLSFFRSSVAFLHISPPPSFLDSLSPPWLSLSPVRTIQNFIFLHYFSLHKTRTYSLLTFRYNSMSGLMSISLPPRTDCYQNV